MCAYISVCARVCVCVCVYLRSSTEKKDSMLNDRTKTYLIFQKERGIKEVKMQLLSV